MQAGTETRTLTKNNFRLGNLATVKNATSSKSKINILSIKKFKIAINCTLPRKNPPGFL